MNTVRTESKCSLINHSWLARKENNVLC